MIDERLINGVKTIGIVCVQLEETIFVNPSQGR